MAAKKKPGVVAKVKPAYYGCAEVMVFLGCKQNKAYEVIRAIRKELMDAGKLPPFIPQGKVPRKYFRERCMIDDE